MDRYWIYYKFMRVGVVTANSIESAEAYLKKKNCYPGFKLVKQTELDFIAM